VRHARSSLIDQTVHMNKLLFFHLFALVTLYSCQASIKDTEKEKLTTECDKFMNTFSQGQFTKAVDLLKPNSLLGEAAVDSLKITISEQMQAIVPRYGKIKSYTFVDEKAVKDLITQRSYLLLFEGFYLKFQFILYKSSYGWKIVGFEYNENIDGLLTK
jgi:hypothetical protein